MYITPILDLCGKSRAHTNQSRVQLSYSLPECLYYIVGSIGSKDGQTRNTFSHPESSTCRKGLEYMSLCLDESLWCRCALTSDSYPMGRRFPVPSPSSLLPCLCAWLYGWGIFGPNTGFQELKGYGALPEAPIMESFGADKPRMKLCNRVILPLPGFRNRKYMTVEGGSRDNSNFTWGTSR